MCCDRNSRFPDRITLATDSLQGMASQVAEKVTLAQPRIRARPQSCLRVPESAVADEATAYSVRARFIAKTRCAPCDLNHSQNITASGIMNLSWP